MLSTDKQRDEYAKKNGFGYGFETKELTFSNSTGTLNLFTVTGQVIVKILPFCTNNVASAAAASVELGVSGDVDAMIASTLATDIDGTNWWIDASPDSIIEALSTAREYMIGNGDDVILTLSAQVDSGDIKFYCFWTPLTNGSSVAAA